MLDLAAIAARGLQLDRIEKKQDRILELLERATPAAEEVGGIADLQAWGGWKTRAGVKAAVARRPELRALAFSVGKSRALRWRRSEVMDLLERGLTRSAPKLRAVGGGVKP